MNNVRTVSDTKRAFYAQHNRPISSLYQRVVEELMVEMHLLSVNVDFAYDPIYALGVVTTFERFTQGYTPESGRQSIFTALVQSVGDSPEQYRQDAEALQSSVAGLSLADLKAQFAAAKEQGGSLLQDTLHKVANNPKFKYSRLFAIGLYTLIESADAEALKDKAQRDALLQEVAEALGLGPEQFVKDLDLYRSNLDKMSQAAAVMKDILEAGRKKREERAKGKEAVTEQPGDTSEDPESKPETV
ncbi:photosystem II biogenesis protein Psp29 [Romeria aff. gracilis LEGE 07310]|uniref:Protein Thf1 n=1 Tax=Vasconcelosia minhoensis LEGE 07310 TaxID=915328 RepID=A0A8J7DKY1_9CYAN|nr:photosystem II biogenesis protein Psp29 [Romeria gracilis]MBE9076836.1 photosystem II biogenesis protein Psp29 [Romeria aff. gracilis LEGE 07310]